MTTSPKESQQATQDNGPGRRATTAEVRQADREIRHLLQTIDGWNLPRAADYIRRESPLSAEAIAFLAYKAHEIFSRARQRHIANQPRQDELNKELGKILKAKPSAVTADVMNALRERVCPNTLIEQVVDDIVTWADNGTLKDTKKTDIAKRISSLKTTLKK